MIMHLVKNKFLMIAHRSHQNQSHYESWLYSYTCKNYTLSDYLKTVMTYESL